MSVDTGSRGVLRGFHFSHESNQFFVTSYVDGKIYGYEISGNLKSEFSVNKVFTAAGQMYPRSVLFLEALNKVVVAYESGLIAFYDIGLPNFPVCELIRLPAPPQRDHHQSNLRARKSNADHFFERQNAEILEDKTASAAGGTGPARRHRPSGRFPGQTPAPPPQPHRLRP